MKFYLCFFVLFLCQFVAAQNRQLSIALGRSFHGTGDMKGVGFAVEYGKYVANRLEITGSIGANVHNDRFQLLLSNGGTSRDASYRMVTGGIQVAGGLHFAPLQTKQNEIRIGLGPMVRYQSSSASGGYSITYPPAINYPEPVFSFQQVEDQNMVTVGYLGSLSYAYTFNRKFFIGANASFQNDTNADVITYYGLRIGRRF